jgi:hypothetical protein
MQEEWFTPGDLGMVLSVSMRPDGKVRLTVEDVVRAGEDLWRHDVPVSFRDFGEAAFMDVTVSEQDLADIGLSIVARLAARVASERKHSRKT